MADGSVHRVDNLVYRVRFVTIAIKKYPWQFHKTQSAELMMEDLPMENNKTPVLVIIYLYDEKSGKLTMLVNIYYI